MKINFDEIPEEGALDVDFLENASELNKLLVKGKDSDFSFNSPAKGSFKLSKKGETVFVSLNIEGIAHAICSKCLSDFEQKIAISNKVDFFPEKKEEETSELDLSSEDIEKSFYADNNIDLAKVLCEEIVLYLPFNPRCSDNCKGLCPTCGKNLNEGKCGCSGKDKENAFSVLKGLKF